MKKTLISLAVIAALPITAMAENISGVMYTAPIAADTNHPAPTTDADPSYGRVNIDTTDQEHIATTAYVKGAYNSAIAAVNKVADTVNNVASTVEEKQNQLFVDGDVVNSDVLYSNGEITRLLGNGNTNVMLPDIVYDVELQTVGENSLMSSREIASIIGALRVPIFTEWGNDSAIGDNALEMVPLNGIPGVTY